MVGQHDRVSPAQIRSHLGFRVATVADQEKLTTSLAENVAPGERRPERIREELSAQFQVLRVEPPTPARLTRMVRSAMRTAEQNWALRISERMDTSTRTRLVNLIAVDDAEVDGGSRESDTVLAAIKSMPGRVSLESMMAEIATVHRIGARAERRVTNELINAFKRVSGHGHAAHHRHDHLWSPI